MIMIYEAEIEQTVMGKLFIEADNLEQAKQVAERCVQEAQNLVDVDFDEIWGYDVRVISIKKQKIKYIKRCMNIEFLLKLLNLILPGVILRMTGLNVINPYSTQKQQTIFLKS